MKSLFVIYGLLLAVFLIMVVISPTYRSAENIGNIIVQCVPLAVVSLGQTVHDRRRHRYVGRLSH